MDEMEFDQQLGPFYMEHGEEILPTGFEEAVEQLASTMGSFSVKSNIVELHDLDLTIGPYDLTKFIQSEWDKFVDEDNPPRRGFLLSSRSPSWAAGRAAEEIVLEKLLWRCLLNGERAVRIVPYWELIDEGTLIRPKGIGSDDICMCYPDGSITVVESKASFNGKAPFARFKGKAVRQLIATCNANACVERTVLAFVDLKARSVVVIAIERAELLTDGLNRVEGLAAMIGVV